METKCQLVVYHICVNYEIILCILRSITFVQNENARTAILIMAPGVFIHIYYLSTSARPSVGSEIFLPFSMVTTDFFKASGSSAHDSDTLSAFCHFPGKTWIFLTIFLITDQRSPLQRPSLPLCPSSARSAGQEQTALPEE